MSPVPVAQNVQSTGPYIVATPVQGSQGYTNPTFSPVHDHMDQGATPAVIQLDEANQPEELEEGEAEEKKKKCRLPPWLILLTVFGATAVSTFDIVTDVFLLREFLKVDGGLITFIFVGITFLSACLFLLEIYYMFQQIIYISCPRKKLKAKSREKYRKRRKKQQSSMIATHEIVSYLLLLVEDLPVNIIIFMLASPRSHLPVTCELYDRVFEQTLIADMALLGAFISALWKGLQSLKYLCVCEWYGCEGDWVRCPCACVRGLRPVFAAVLCFVAGYVYFVFNKSFTIEDVRPECMEESQNGTSTFNATTFHVNRNNTLI